MITLKEPLDFTLNDIVKKESKRSPQAPFTTSTLQQEASRKFGYGVKQTMMIAQKLYE
jgi:DNA topoisomerase I